MANHLSSKKRIRHNARRTAINNAREARVHTFTKKFESALTTGDKAAATEAFRTAESEIMRAVSKGVLHRNTAARRVSRLAAKVKALA
ncbi:MAG: 30S ribosomal protein S20 [Alphaproteobacteria bacterium]|nr:30S ribosomal protein S20 [Alphaproteobacteria bacterium]